MIVNQFFLKEEKKMKRLSAFLGGIILYIALIPEPSLAQEVVWSRVFKYELYHGRNHVYSVQQTSDEGYILVLEASPRFQVARTFTWLIKTDSEGQMEWGRTFEDSDQSMSMRPYCVQQTTDGGYILGGFTYPVGGVGPSGSGWIIKTNSEGQEQWKRIFDYIGFLQQTTDGGYILAGSTSGVGWLIKTDSEGQTEWKSTFGDGLAYVADGNVHQNCWPKSVQQTTDGGYILAGTSFSSLYTYYSWLVKTDSKGQKEWERMFGDEIFCGSGNSVQQTTDGGYILASEKYRDPTPAPITWDGWLLKTDSKGQKEWERTFGDEYRDLDSDDKGSQLYIPSAKQTLDGGYILAIEKIVWKYHDGRRETYIIKTSSKGQKEWEMTFSQEVGQEDCSFNPSTIITNSDGDYVVAGHIYNKGGWLAKIRGRQTQVSVEEKNQPSAFTLSQNYPNPFNPTTEIAFSLLENSYVTLSVFNTLGQKVATLVDEKRQTGNHRVIWDGTGFPTGIYFYRLETQDFAKTMKMLLMK